MARTVVPRIVEHSLRHVLVQKPSRVVRVLNEIRGLARCGVCVPHELVASLDERRRASRRVAAEERPLHLQQLAVCSGCGGGELGWRTRGHPCVASVWGCASSGRHAQPQQRESKNCSVQSVLTPAPRRALERASPSASVGAPSCAHSSRPSLASSYRRLAPSRWSGPTSIAHLGRARSCAACLEQPPQAACSPSWVHPDQARVRLRVGVRLT